MATKTITLAVVSSCLLLLLLAHATTAISISGGVGGITGGTATTVPDDVPPFVFPGGGGSGGAAAAGCWNAVLRAEICAGDILRSVASFLLHFHDGGALHPWGGAVHVGAPCCGVLQAVGDRCFRDLLADSPFHPLYAPFVNQVCGGGGLPVGGRGDGGVIPGHRD